MTPNTTTSSFSASRNCVENGFPTRCLLAKEWKFHSRMQAETRVPEVRGDANISSFVRPSLKRLVIAWLLDSDPSIRWQVMRDLTDAPTEEVAAERARVATEGAGAQLLALQWADGRWGGVAWNRGWNSPMHALVLLRGMGRDPASDKARRAVGLVRDGVTWKGCGPRECDGNPFFAGEVEPCINGQVGAVGAYFGQDVRGIVDTLLTEQ